MIIELFGAPGAGKSTFANALAKRLRERGYVVEVQASARPNESNARAPEPGFERWAMRLGSPSLLRVARAAQELVAAMDATDGRGSAATALLHDSLRPKGLLSALRLKQYLNRLARRWRQALEAEHIVVFDQAYIQALVSHILASGCSEKSAIDRVLDRSPLGDVLIRIEAPRHVIARRLRERLSSQGFFERRFELDLDASLEAIRIVAKLEEALASRGRVVFHGDSLDMNFLDRAVDEVGRLLPHGSRASSKEG